MKSLKSRSPSNSFWLTGADLALGIGVVMLGAGLLVLRNGLPRWMFGDPLQSAQVSPLWPAMLFLTYAGLGMLVLASIPFIDFLLDRYRVTKVGKRLLIGSAIILKILGIGVLFVPPVAYRLVFGKAPTNLGHFGFWALAAILSVSAYVCLVLHRTAKRQRVQERRLRHESENLGTALARAELAMLEAQVEPHFLFNTLAHIKRQYRKDPAAADRMLGALIEYLERALPAVRSAEWTVGDEIGLIEVYLNILALRFGEQLRFVISMQEPVRSIHLPGLTVATLVENAVRHGLAPKKDGGTVTVDAMIEAETVVIAVCDDGVGLRMSSGSGLGLATTRARLRSVYADKATLHVEPRQPKGVRAVLTIPVAA